MKKSNLLLVASIALTIASCRKELATNDALTAQSVKVANTTSSAPTIPETKVSLSKTSMNYGAWILAPTTDEDPYGFVTHVAGQLNVACIRDITPVPGVKKVKTLFSKYNVLLNFSTKKPQPMKFRTDLTTYQTDLKNTIASLTGMPAIAIIENEESNKGYYSGSAIDYINQLKAAIAVMHSYGIPVTNGGITSVGLEYLVYQDYMNRGMTAEANDYKKRMHIAVNNADTKDRASFISVLIANYATIDLDYVNFHWRSQTSGDAQGLGETIDYLKRATGKKIITTEIGQYDHDPATLTVTVQMCKNYNLPYLIWYSGQEEDRSYPLQFNNEALTATGTSYKSFISTNK